LNKTVGKNVAYLGLVQAANYLFPLITVPHISRAIGVSRYGLVELALISIIYFTALVDYSFDVSGTRKMARVRHRPAQVQLLFNSIFFAKLFLFVVASLIFLFALFFVPVFAEHKGLFAAAYLVNLSYIFYPNWFFQGKEQLGVIAFANFFIKALFTVLVFSFVRNEGDYFWVPLSNSFGYIVVALVIFFYAFKDSPQLKLRFPGWRPVMAVIKDGQALFISSLLNKLYALSGMAIAGLYVQERDLGYFGAANKLYMVMLSMMFYPLHGAVFPHLTATLKKSKSDFARLFKRLGIGLFLIYGLGLILLYFFSPFIINLLFGTDFEGAVPLFRWLIPALFFGIFTHMFVTQGLLTLRFDRWQLRWMAVFAGLSVAGNFWMAKYFGVGGVVVFKACLDATMALSAGWLFFNAWKRYKR
jgi:polysaccharide transporter, PST family